MDVLADLTDAQREAVAHVDGPMLVVAGAGTGKTRVVTRRLAHLVSRGIPPWSLLAVTFTNKAAREMKERVASLVGAAPIWVSTFHSMGARLLRRHGEVLGYPRDFTILDRDDQISAVRRALSDLEIDPKQFPPARVLEAISLWKQSGTAAVAAGEGASSYADRTRARAYAKYEEALRRCAAMDFDDLLVNLASLLEGKADVACSLRERFRYVSVDEYQDTNRLQYRISVALAGDRRNLCVTGDPDQSIYSWRGADLRNILDFQEDFPEAKVVRLERNYRSVRRILRAASALISRNRQRIERGLDSENEEGPRLLRAECLDEHDEAREVCRRVAELREAGTPFGQIAVFYRVNAQSRVIETALRNAGVPYALVGAVAFFQRREVKDLLAYGTIAVNPRQDEALLRILNVPARGLGEKAEERLRAHAASRGIPLRSAIEEAKSVPALGRKAVEGALALDRILRGLEERKELPARAALSWLVKRLDFLSYAASLDGTEESDRAENVRELVSAAADYDARGPQAVSPSVDGGAPDAPPVGLAGFLEEVALVSDTDRTTGSGAEGGAGGVWLMTFHAAKGLEFDAVVITGLEEGLLPHSLSEGPDGVEEERRLLYVGLTRARKSVALLSARLRRRFGQAVPAIPSQFLEEIPEELVEVRGETGGSVVEAAARWEPGESRMLVDEDVDAPSGDEDGPEGLAPGIRVRHPMFGVGKVESLEGRGENACAAVRFPRIGVKRLLLSYARLERA
ncbi:MAG: UvrD-helicase domain-containing protein [Planctomycetes bacterium]|nr:UvrD-helicase domain-containing protein [Planctomycetota bacterium]